MKITILIFNLLILTVCTAQKNEYVITKKGDTIFGKVTRTSSLLNPSKINFKIKDINGNNQMLNPKNVETIKSVKGVDGESIIKTVYGKSYVKLILDGKIKVYQLVNGVIYYTSKDNSEIKLNDFGGFNSKKESHEKMRLLFIDNPTILKEFDTLTGTEKNILNMIKKYNSLYD